MGTVKIFLVMLGLQWATCAAQKIKTPDSLNINSSNAQTYFIRAKEIIKNQERDSLFEASTILRRLYYFDSLKYSKQEINILYDKISKINLHHYQKIIPGQWKLAFRGSNWSTNNYGDTTGESLQINQNHIRFYKNGKLTRKTKYKITNRYAQLSKEFEFQIYFFDSNSYWHISTMENYSDYFSKLTFDKNHIGLMVDSGPFCSDCGYEIYITEKIR
jgi:anaerobic selenocysteine-containing dehydrogenase